MDILERYVSVVSFIHPPTQTSSGKIWHRWQYQNKQFYHRRQGPRLFSPPPPPSHSTYIIYFAWEGGRASARCCLGENRPSQMLFTLSHGRVVRDMFFHVSFMAVAASGLHFAPCEPEGAFSLLLEADVLKALPSTLIIHAMLVSPRSDC